MAILSSDGKYVTVVKGDTLSEIALKYLKDASKYKQLANINKIPNPNLIYIGQKIYLYENATSSSTTTKASSNKATIHHFGYQSNVDNTYLATWTWTGKTPDKYLIQWQYYTKDNYWFVGEDTDTKYTYSTYSVPANAIKIQFRVKPMAKPVQKESGDYYPWNAEWTSWVRHDISENIIGKPPVPSDITIKDFKLTVELDNLDVNANGIWFEIWKNDIYRYNAGPALIISGHASYSCTVAAGNEYKVRCRAYSGKVYGEWSDFSSNIGTIPTAPKGIKTIRATSETSVYLEWDAVKNATEYEIEYTTEKRHFDGSDQTQTKPPTKFTHFEITGLTSGDEYFFRIRAINGNGESGWSGIKSVVIGEAPSAPTTWSSTTTAVVGQPITLYWLHSSEDNSNERLAQVEIDFKYGDNVPRGSTIDIQNEDVNDNEENKTGMFILNGENDPYGFKRYIKDGVEILWRVRTAGITKEYGEWSIKRAINVYTPPTLEIDLDNSEGTGFSHLTNYPFYISALAEPKTQTPTGYHLTIKSRDAYDTVDNMGNPKTINVGDEVYSKYFDISDELKVEMTAKDVTLENGMEYEVVCDVSMDSGLTASSAFAFEVSWDDTAYIPNAEIGINDDIYSASIRPYCEDVTLHYHKVSKSGNIYTKSNTKLEEMFGNLIEGAKTTTGEQVYSGTTGKGEDVYYCIVETSKIIEGVLLSVYRREFDGSFTEIAKDLDNTKNTYITDPHPALDYARYRIIAKAEATGAIGYYDVPNYPVGGKSIIIQWDEDWSTFSTNNNEALAEPTWSGSLLKLPYNIDVSEKNKLSVELVEYIGRKRPISYYGTQLGESATWNTEIPKDDEETIYALRRLSIWPGNVYVREPSGTGYWANITVSFNQKHCDVTIPVSLELVRVEGGV